VFDQLIVDENKVSRVDENDVPRGFDPVEGGMNVRPHHQVLKCKSILMPLLESRCFRTWPIRPAYLAPQSGESRLPRYPIKIVEERFRDAVEIGEPVTEIQRRLIIAKDGYHAA